MDSTIFNILVGVLMLGVSVALIAWYMGYLGASSESRMMRMLKRAGVDPEIIRRRDTEAIIRDVRSRCQKCPSEALCERWLAGNVEGKNTFCPNHRIFSKLTRMTGHAA
jgi:hypothetical protein